MTSAVATAPPAAPPRRTPPALQETGATLIVLIAHAPLATAYVALARHVHGQAPAGLLAVDVAEGVPHEKLLEDTLERVAGEGFERLLLLVDLPGASPCRIAQQLAVRAGRPSRVVAGLNAAMLLVVLEKRRDASLARLAAMALQGGRASICPVALAEAE